MPYANRLALAVLALILSPNGVARDYPRDRLLSSPRRQNYVVNCLACSGALPVANKSAQALYTARYNTGWVYRFGSIIVEDTAYAQVDAKV